MRYHWLLGALLLGAFPPSSLAAQERDTTAAAAKDDSSKSVIVLPPLVLTGSIVPLRASEVGFALSIIGPDELAIKRPLYAADALRGIPGSFIDEAVGPGGPTIVRLRGGEEVFTQILMDGVQVNQNGGFFDFQGVTLTNIERIEIARGPQSALYGSSAVSGVAHFITRRGRPGPPQLEFTTEGGLGEEHGGNFRSTLTIGGGGPGLRYSAGVGATYNRGIYEFPHDTWTRDASLRLDASPTSRWDLSGTFRFIGVESKLPVRDPGATRAPLDPNARDERNRFVSSAEATFRPVAGWTNRLKASSYREDFLFEDQFDDAASAGTFDFFIFDANFALDSRLWRHTIEYAGSHELDVGRGNSEFTLSYGARIEREDLSDRTTGDFGDAELQLDRNSIAGFAEAQATIGRRVSFLAGTRLERFEGLTAEFTPRASAVVDAVPGRLSFRGAVGRAYKAPNLQQQYLDNPFIASNPDLVPETSTSWEIGSKLHAARGALTLEITYFRQKHGNLIQLVPRENSTQAIYRNLSSIRAQGIEWAADYTVSPSWRIGTNGAWTDTKVLDNSGLSPSAFPVDSALPFRPDVVGSAFLEWRPNDRLSATLRNTYVGAQTVLTERFSGQRADLESYLLTGVTVNVQVTRRLGLYARIDNVLDVDYETAFDRGGIPRTATLGLRVTN